MIGNECAGFGKGKYEIQRMKRERRDNNERLCKGGKKPMT